RSRRPMQRDPHSALRTHAARRARLRHPNGKSSGTSALHPPFQWEQIMTTPVHDFLLVPMHLDARRGNQQDAAATPFFRFQMDYSLLDFFEAPEPPPFDANSY